MPGELAELENDAKPNNFFFFFLQTALCISYSISSLRIAEQITHFNLLKQKLNQKQKQKIMLFAKFARSSSHLIKGNFMPTFIKLKTEWKHSINLIVFGISNVVFFIILLVLILSGCARCFVPCVVIFTLFHIIWKQSSSRNFCIELLLWKEQATNKNKLNLEKRKTGEKNIFETIQTIEECTNKEMGNKKKELNMYTTSVRYRVKLYLNYNEHTTQNGWE